MSERPRGRIWLAVAVGAVLVVAVALWWSSGGSGLFDGGGEDRDLQGEEELRRLDLYFPDVSGRLAAEERELAVRNEPAEQVRAVVQALLAGPKRDGSIRPLPEEVEVAGVLLSAGVAYVDLRAGEAENPPPTGSLEELLTIYSLVNSVAENVPEARRVVLLWNGRQRESFAGHVDTSGPLLPDPALVAR